MSRSVRGFQRLSHWPMVKIAGEHEGRLPWARQLFARPDPIRFRTFWAVPRWASGRENGALD